MSVARALVLLNPGTLFGRTLYLFADSPWPNHMDDSGLVSSTMSPPLGATKHGRTLALCVFGGPIQANCWPTLQQGPDPRFACADGGRAMAQRAALIEGFRPFGWCLCLFLQLSAENQQLSYHHSPRSLFFFRDSFRQFHREHRCLLLTDSLTERLP